MSQKLACKSKNHVGSKCIQLAVFRLQHPIHRSQPRQMCCCCCIRDDCSCRCRPLAFLLGLPFALLSVLLSLIGVLVWIIGILLSFLCPCCICATVIVEVAIGLIKAPIHVMDWFTQQIPC